MPRLDPRSTLARPTKRPSFSSGHGSTCDVHRTPTGRGQGRSRSDASKRRRHEVCALQGLFLKIVCSRYLHQQRNAHIGWAGDLSSWLAAVSWPTPEESA